MSWEGFWDTVTDNIPIPGVGDVVRFYKRRTEKKEKEKLENSLRATKSTLHLSLVLNLIGSFAIAFLLVSRSPENHDLPIFHQPPDFVLSSWRNLELHQKMAAPVAKPKEESIHNPKTDMQLMSWKT
jgi:hypothetical protein